MKKEYFLPHEDKFGPGFIMDWLICGLFEAPLERNYDDPPPELTDTLASVGGEKNVVPYNGLVVKWQDKTFPWFTYHAHSVPCTPFSTKFSLEVYPRWCYFASYIESSKDKDVLVGIGVQHGYVFWLNHDFVAEHRFPPREDDPDEDLFRVGLKKGLNLVLLKVHCYRYTPLLFFRITDLNRGKISSIKIRLRPEKIIKPKKNKIRKVCEEKKEPDNSVSIFFDCNRFRGGVLNKAALYEAPAGSCRLIYSKSSGKNFLETCFLLEQKLSASKVNKLLLLDCWGHNARVKLYINRNLVWDEILKDGSFKHYQKRRKFFHRKIIEVKYSYLKPGKNELTIENSTKDGPLGRAPVFALRYAKLILSENVRTEKNLKIIRIGAERFDGEHKTEHRIPPVYVATYALKYLAETVKLPEEGEIKAPFILDSSPEDNENEKSYYLLNIHPLLMSPPLIKTTPWGNPEKELSHLIQINGHTVNNFYRSDIFRKAPFMIPIPSSYLKRGVNILTIKRTDSPVTILPSKEPIIKRPFNLSTNKIEYFSLVERRIKDCEILTFPRCVYVGQKFYVKIELLKSNILKEVISHPDIIFLGKLPFKVKKGIRRLYFKVRKPLNNQKILLKFEDKETSWILAWASDVQEPKIKHQIFNLVSTDPNVYENHVKAIEGMKDFDLGNTLHQRQNFSENVSRELIKRLAKLYKKENIYMSYSWRAIERKGGKLKVDENDLKRWAGEYLFYGGSARIDPKILPGQNLLEIKKSYVQSLKKFYRQNPTFGCHINQLWHRYALEAGSKFPWIQLNYSNSEMVISSLRGCARAYGLSDFGVSGCDDCAVVMTDNIRYFRMSTLHNWVAYLSGVTSFLPEFTTKLAWMGYFLPQLSQYFSQYFEYKYHQKRLELEKEFYDYIRTHKRGYGPITNLAFVQGNLDGWDGLDGFDGKNAFLQGYYRPGRRLWQGWAGRSKWPLGPAEAGWRYLRTVFTGVKFILMLPLIYPKERQFYFSGTPYGKVDIVPDEAPIDKLMRYKALIFLAWNTATEKQYEKLKKYVQQGGILFMALRQLSTQVDREGKIELLRGGDFSDLFGVKIERKGKKIERIKFQNKVYELLGHERNQIYSSRLRVIDSKPLAVDENGSPVIVEKRLGKGRAYLLCLWNYPGEEKLGSFIEDFIRKIAESVEGKVRVSGNENVNFSVYMDREGNFQEGEVVTRIFIVDIDWWSVGKEYSSCTVHLNGKPFKVTLPRAEIKEIVFFKNIALSSRQKEVYIESIKETNGGYSVILQGGGSYIFDVFCLEGEIQTIVKNGRKLKFSQNKIDGTVSFSLTLSGREELKINLTAH